MEELIFLINRAYSKACIRNQYSKQTPNSLAKITKAFSFTCKNQRETHKSKPACLKKVVYVQDQFQENISQQREYEKKVEFQQIQKLPFFQVWSGKKKKKAQESQKVHGVVCLSSGFFFHKTGILFTKKSGFGGTSQSQCNFEACNYHESLWDKVTFKLNQKVIVIEIYQFTRLAFFFGKL